MSERFTIRPAASPADLESVRELFREYERWLDANLCFQGFETEVASLPGRYAEPSGRLYVAHADGALAGCIGLRTLEPGVCEMKRLYVRDVARGLGLGRALARRVIEDGRTMGCRVMRLDTLRIEKMRTANVLYDALGFRDIPAYYDNPLPDVRYMELDLVAPAARA